MFSLILFQGKLLVVYIKAWHNVLNRVASENGLVAFEFNSYIISVLVIFFLQVKRNFPTFKDLLAFRINRFPLNGHFNQFLHDFFSFYGYNFDAEKHVISLHVGKLQNREVLTGQNSLEQQW